MSGKVVDPFFDVARGLKQFALPNDFRGTWATKHPLNIPGPIYVGDDCSCGTGPVAAPNNVILLCSDEESYVTVGRVVPQGGEFLYRQPGSMFELKQVLDAAARNAPSTYALDGNAYWTRQLVVAWWHEARSVRLALAANIKKFSEQQRAPSVSSASPAMPWPWPKPKVVAEPEPLPWPSPDLQRWNDFNEDGLEHYLREYCYFLDNRRVPTAETNLPPL
jgi:hypothetical protein